MQRIHYKVLEKLQEGLNEKKKIIITTHQGPDGDAMGSSLALYHFLKALGHDVHVIVPNDYPSFLNWMPGTETVLNYMRQKEQAEVLIETCEMVFCLDFNAIRRTADMTRSLAKIKVPRVLIDHHIDPELPAKYVFSIPDACATCEILYYMLKAWNVALITPEIATCLYTGLMTDTGNFCYNNTTARSFQIASALMQMGIDRTMIYDKIFNSHTEDRMRLMGYCLNQAMRIYNGNTALITLNLEEQAKYNFQSGDTEGFVNLPLAIDNIKFSALFLEKEDKIKISFRSKGGFSVNDFAVQQFGGGGHVNAAGAEARCPMSELIYKFINALPEYQEALQNS